jgi:hypothetical protein
LYPAGSIPASGEALRRRASLRSREFFNSFLALGRTPPIELDFKTNNDNAAFSPGLLELGPRCSRGAHLLACLAARFLSFDATHLSFRHHLTTNPKKTRRWAWPLH